MSSRRPTSNLMRVLDPDAAAAAEARRIRDGRERRARVTSLFPDAAANTAAEVREIRNAREHARRENRAFAHDIYSGYAAAAAAAAAPADDYAAAAAAPAGHHAAAAGHAAAAPAGHHAAAAGHHAAAAAAPAGRRSHAAVRNVFAAGGVVPGPIGKAVKVVCHGGELIVPAAIAGDVMASSVWRKYCKSH